MTMYSLNKATPVDTMPERIRLSDNSTRTDSTTFTSEEFTDAGWAEVEDKPSVNEKTHKVIWSGEEWQTVALSVDELQTVKTHTLDALVKQRDQEIDAFEWRIQRYHSFARQGKDQIDDIAKLDKYVQDLRDCINRDDPDATVFPSWEVGEEV
ncbi:MAG: hypothetical protein Unbinned1190contig1000_4 [Prokaryotic dsDNA virus sp.]|mgnify:FL=1|nr:MAG: hypothetical protein Unbinned1190contig1000_4 [Prokaryotic dsDNA virus sp.]